ncbi:hypothetical protein CKO28_18445 [Rhodovibrio sodomensis]|uniref:Uncharacterized protein n=1 Tax=Rhodovibrio sodomensis TaxID=1088 RepID=A0ABS1DHR5_9PROT|nr:hypothetical protein [Rhodovibrio sodomensis]MBK1670017.1 hypothetical protein [Rhodovibrio sodomensis]
MTSPLFLAAWATAPTWSLREAALLLHGHDPDREDVPIGEKIKTPVSQTYYWLKKEYITGQLTAVAGTDDEPRFGPGTIIRRRLAKRYHVSPKLHEAWENGGHLSGNASQAEMAFYHYRLAAQTIWQDHPEITLDEMAQLLAQLPHYTGTDVIPPRAPETIKGKYLTGISPRHRGRPSKKEPTGDINLAAVAQKIAA